MHADIFSPFMERIANKNINTFLLAFFSRIKTVTYFLRCFILFHIASLVCLLVLYILYLLSYSVSGRYDADLRDLSLRFRGSRNQRIIDLKKTFSEGEIVLWDD